MAIQGIDTLVQGASTLGRGPATALQNVRQNQLAEQQMELQKELSDDQIRASMIQTFANLGLNAAMPFVEQGLNRRWEYEQRGIEAPSMMDRVRSQLQEWRMNSGNRRADRLEARAENIQGQQVNQYVDSAADQAQGDQARLDRMQGRIDRMRERGENPTFPGDSNLANARLTRAGQLQQRYDRRAGDIEGTDYLSGLGDINDRAAGLRDRASAIRGSLPTEEDIRDMRNVPQTIAEYDEAQRMRELTEAERLRRETELDLIEERGAQDRAGIAAEGDQNRQLEALRHEYATRILDQEHLARMTEIDKQYQMIRDNEMSKREHEWQMYEDLPEDQRFVVHNGRRYTWENKAQYDLIQSIIAADVAAFQASLGRDQSQQDEDLSLAFTSEWATWLQNWAYQQGLAAFDETEQFLLWRGKNSEGLEPDVETINTGRDLFVQSVLNRTVGGDPEDPDYEAIRRLATDYFNQQITNASFIRPELTGEEEKMPGAGRAFQIPEPEDVVTPTDIHFTAGAYEDAADQYREGFDFSRVSGIRGANEERAYASLNALMELAQQAGSDEDLAWARENIQDIQENRRRTASVGYYSEAIDRITKLRQTLEQMRANESTSQQPQRPAIGSREQQF